MKREMKQRISLLVAAIMIVTLFPVIPVNASLQMSGGESVNGGITGDEVHTDQGWSVLNDDPAWEGGSYIATDPVAVPSKIYDSLVYTISNDTVTITDCDEEATEIIIPKKIEGKKVTRIGDAAFENCGNLERISIPESIKDIGRLAFFMCDNLTKIKLPSGLTSIGEKAFYMTGLTEIKIPPYVTCIQAETFSFCTDLKSVEIPSSVTSIEKWAFYECGSLTDIEIPDNVITIGEMAFNGCSMNRVVIPAHVENIGDCAFRYCNNLTDVNYSEGVKDTGKYTFQSCKNLKNVSLPSSITNIGLAAFDDCVKLNTIKIPASVTNIEGSAFSGCRSLQSIDIPFSVKSIGGYAFSGCRSLRSMNIPSSVESLESTAFSLCNNLESINIEKNNQFYKSIDGIIFDKNETTLVRYPIGIKNSSYKIPSNVATIGKHAFSECENLTDIIIPSGVVNIEAYAFSECDHLISISLPSSVTTIGAYAFSGCSNMTDALISSSVTNIESEVFSGCNKLKRITIPSEVTTIGLRAFSGCTNLTTIILPLSVSDIQYGAFSYCNRVKDIYYSGDKKQWEKVSIEEDNGILSSVDIHYNSEQNNPFEDVNAAKYFYNAVLWAYNASPQITNGMDESHFGPDLTVTRGQAVTFLWRSRGCPEPDNFLNPFNDVDSADYFYKAVLWAVEQGITIGTDSTSFSPEQTLTRAHMLSFIYRTLGEPGKIGVGEWYSDAENWGDSTGILNDTSVPYKRDDHCPRCDVVYYLFNISDSMFGTETITESWSEILESVNDGTYRSKYHVGDTKSLGIGSEGFVDMQIAAIDEDELADGSGKAAITWISKQLLHSSHRMNPALEKDPSNPADYVEGTGNIGGWACSEMREWLKNDVKPLIPFTVRKAIRTVTKYSASLDTSGSGVRNYETADDVWIPSLKEVFGTNLYYENKGPVYTELFASDSDRTKYYVGNNWTSTWSLRSSYIWENILGRYRFVYSDGKDQMGLDYDSPSDNSYGVALGFCV